MTAPWASRPRRAERGGTAFHRVPLKLSLHASLTAPSIGRGERKSLAARCAAKYRCRMMIELTRMPGQNEDSMILQGKVVAVTGGFGQLGMAVAQAALEAGAHVAALDRARVPAETAALARTFAQGDLDLAEPEIAEQAMDRIVARFGGMDALVNVAGTFRWETLEQGSLDTWDLLYRVNLRTAASASRAALPHLIKRGGGRIVNIGAGAASKASAGMGAYTASKAGVAKLTEALAEELKDRGITVNAVLPSIIDTPANRADMPKADFSRWVPPRAIADVIVFLLSDQARAITGALIPVSGRV
jgi:NAD(P)-dependent dehydrogenase (short-subunit alcohol dehydrogenase family)